jgi:hypothetical protein
MEDARIATRASLTPVFELLILVASENFRRQNGVSTGANLSSTRKPRPKKSVAKVISDYLKERKWLQTTKLGCVGEHKLGSLVEPAG